MKNFILKLFRKKSNVKLFHINYSDLDITILGKSKARYYTVGTIREAYTGKLLGCFTYIFTKFGAVLQNRNNNKKYYLIKCDSPHLAGDAWIHPIYGTMHNACSLRNFLKIEFGL